VTFTDQGAATAMVFLDEQQGLARLLFSAMPDSQFDCFAAGLEQVLGVLRSAVAQADGTTGAASDTR
jgi:hypothetical protein